jgi:hypothetical protein
VDGIENVSSVVASERILKFDEGGLGGDSIIGQQKLVGPKGSATRARWICRSRALAESRTAPKKGNDSARCLKSHSGLQV